MPFDLFVSPARWGQWREAAGALEREPLPDGSAVKEIDTPGYRDRYAIVSGAELMAMIRARGADDLARRLEAANKGPLLDHLPFLLHWEEWESGM